MITISRVDVDALRVMFYFYYYIKKRCAYFRVLRFEIQFRQSYMQLDVVSI